MQGSLQVGDWVYLTAKKENWQNVTKVLRLRESGFVGYAILLQEDNGVLQEEGYVWSRWNLVRNITQDAKQHKLTPEEAVYYSDLIRKYGP